MKKRLEIGCYMIWTNVRARGHRGGWKKMLGYRHKMPYTEPEILGSTGFYLFVEINTLIHRTNSR